MSLSMGVTDAVNFVTNVYRNRYVYNSTFRDSQLFEAQYVRKLILQHIF